MQSYSYNTAEVRIVWRDWEPVTIPDPDSKNLPDFVMTNLIYRNQTLLYTAGMWDQLEVVMTFKRLYGYYVLQVGVVKPYYTKLIKQIAYKHFN